MDECDTDTLTLKPKTLIHICGWPVETVDAVTVSGSRGNIELVRRDLYLGERHGVPQSPVSFGTTTVDGGSHAAPSGAPEGLARELPPAVDAVDP